MDPFVLVIIFLFAVAVLYLRSPTAKGARGERRVRRVLAKRLVKESNIVIHDITLSIGADTTQIDHVVFLDTAFSLSRLKITLDGFSVIENQSNGLRSSMERRLDSKIRCAKTTNIQKRLSLF